MEKDYFSMSEKRRKDLEIASDMNAFFWRAGNILLVLFIIIFFIYNIYLTGRLIYLNNFYTPPKEICPRIEYLCPPYSYRPLLRRWSIWILSIFLVWITLKLGKLEYPFFNRKIKSPA